MRPSRRCWRWLTSRSLRLHSCSHLHNQPPYVHPGSRCDIDSHPDCCPFLDRSRGVIYRRLAVCGPRGVRVGLRAARRGPSKPRGVPQGTPRKPVSARQRRFPAPLAPPRFATTAPVCHLEHQSEAGIPLATWQPPAQHRVAYTEIQARALRLTYWLLQAHRSLSTGSNPQQLPVLPPPRFVHIPRSAFNRQSGRLPRARRSQPRATRCSTAATPPVTSTAACTTALPPSLWPPSRHRFLAFMDRSGEALAEEWQDSHRPP